jgi:hypothetical protein
MLPRTLDIVSNARRLEMPIWVAVTKGEITRAGESKRVSGNGAPLSAPPLGSNRTAHRLKNDDPWFEMK